MNLDENPLQYLIDAVHAYVAGNSQSTDPGLAKRTKDAYIAALQKARADVQNTED